jgi:hypothetical protein
MNAKDCKELYEALESLSKLLNMIITDGRTVGEMKDALTQAYAGLIVIKTGVKMSL